MPEDLDLAGIADAAQQYVKAKKPSLREVYEDSADSDPKKNAEIMGLSKQTGHDPAYVANNTEAVKSQVATPSGDFLDAIEKNNPVAAKFLRQPDNMAVAHHDITNIAAHENLVNQAHAVHSWMDAVEGGAQSSVMGWELRGKPPGYELPPDAPIHHRFLYSMASLGGDFPTMTLGGVLGTVAGSPAGPPGMLIGGGAGTFALPAALKKAMQDAYYKGKPQTAGELLDRATGIMKEGGKQGIVGAFTMGVGGAAAKLAGGTFAGPAAKGIEEIGKAALARGAAEYAGMVGAGSAVEGRAPTIQEGVDVMLQLGAMKGISKARNAYADRIRTEAARNFYSAMGDTAKASQLRENLPDAHKQYLHMVTNGTPVENVYVPTEAFEKHWQGQNRNPIEAARDLGHEAAYKEALATGTDMKVPLADWVSKYVGTNNYEKLADDVKFHQDALTPNQIKERNASISQQIAVEQAMAQEAVKINPEVKAAHDSIVQDITQKLAATGYLRETSKEAKGADQKIDANAKLIADHYVTEGMRRKVDPLHLYNEDIKQLVSEGQKGNVSIISMKHGETSIDVDGKSHGANHDAPLTPNGRDQISKTAEKLRGATRIIASDTIRGRETADILGKHLGIKPEIDPGLNPLRGSWPGGETQKDMEPVFKKVWAEPDGKQFSQESPNEFGNRVLNVRDRAVSQSKPGDKIVMVGHSDVHQRMMLDMENKGKPLSPEKWQEMLKKEGAAPGEFSTMKYDPATNQFSEVQEQEGLTSDKTYPIIGQYGHGRDAGPSAFREPLQSLPASSPGPTPEIREAAKLYAKEAGLPHREQAAYATADPERGRRIAADFDRLKHDPQNPEVKAAYNALIKETLDQFQVMKKMGVKMEAIKPDQPNPYHSSADMIADVRKGHLWFFPTDQGFGTDTNLSDHPLYEQTKEKLDDGTPLRANDVFRIVHDFFGHAKEGVGFGANGEENAWNSHVRMYSNQAARAMTTETRGQNSWVNFGPHGEKNRADPMNTHYADQKAALLPDWATSEGMAPDKAEIKRGHVKMPSPEDMKILREHPEIADEARMLNRISTTVKQPKLDAILKDVADKVGGDVKGTPKSVQSIVKKIVRKVENEGQADYHGLSLKDLSRGAVIAKPEGIAKAAKELGAHGIKIEQFVDEPLNAFGYRGVHGAIDLGDGFRGEVQFHTPESWAIKEESDKIYDKWRQHSENEVSSWMKADPARYREYIKDIARSQKMWNDYWDRIPEETRRSISDLGKGRDSETSPTLRSSEGSAHDLEAGSKTSSLSSEAQTNRPSGSLESRLASSAEGLSSSLTSAISISAKSISPEGPKVKGVLPSAVSSELSNKYPGHIFQGERGFYDPENKVIGLMKGADASTFMHEVAHTWLDSAFKFINTGQADEAYMKHWDDAKQWLKIGDEQDALTRDQHEKFAKGFEQYLMEGKAPTPELKGVFSNFRRWLTDVYRRRPVSSDLSPEVRGFMDRMLATDDALEAAGKESGYQPAEIQSIPDMDPKTQEKHRALQEKAHDAAESILLKEQMAEFSRENSDFLQNERDRLSKDAEAQAMNMPVFRAEAELLESLGRRFDIRNLAAKYVEDETQVGDEHAALLEAAAERNGYASGHALSEALGKADLHGEVKGRMDKAMSSYAGMMDNEYMKQKALEAIHTEKTAELLAIEGQILKGMTFMKEFNAEQAKISRAEAAADAKAAREQAQQLLAGKPIDEAANFKAYYTAEKNAAMRVSSALARGKAEEAGKAKQQQLLNHALALEALKNSREIDKAMNYLGRFDKLPGDLMKMPFAFGKQINGLLVNAGLKESEPEDRNTRINQAELLERTRLDPGEVANKTGLIRGADGKWRDETLKEFQDRLNEDYHAISLPDNLIQQSQGFFQQRTPRLSLQELRDLTGAVKQLEYNGKQYERFLSDFIKGDIKTNAAALKKHISDNIGQPYGGNPLFGNVETSRVANAVESIRNIPDGMIPSKVNLLTLAEYLDLKKGDDGHFYLDPDGPAKNNIFRPLDKADDIEVKRRGEAVKSVDSIRKRYYSEKEIGELTKPVMTWDVETPQGKKKINLTKENILNLALHQGTDSNIDRVTKGFGIDESQLRNVTNSLNERDWNFVKDMWRYLDEFWPEAKQLEMDVNGREPEKVEGRMVQTPFGKLRGGYYPLSYDYDKSLDALKNAEQRNALYKQYSAAGAHTEQGFLKGRVNNLSRPLDLTFDGFFRHLDDVIHDLSYRKSVIDVSRFLNQPDTREAIVGAIGMNGYKKIQEDLKSAASVQSDFLSGFDKWARWFRFKTTFATLAYRAVQLPVRLGDDVLNSMRELGPMRAISSAAEYVTNPTAIRDFVRQNSTVMQNRGITRERDLVEMSNKWKGKQSLFQHWGFLHDTLADQAMSYPVWKASYEKFLPEYGHDKAVELSDEAIIKTFGSGRQLERVGAQRGGELSRLASMYYSWWSMMFNRAWLQGKIAGLEYKQGNLGSAMAITAATAATTVALPAMNKIFWTELFRNNPDGTDEDERKKRITAHVVAAPFSIFPWGRNVGEFIGAKVAGEHTRHIDLSPVETAFNDLMQGAWAAVEPIFDPQKEYDKKHAEEIAHAAAIATKTPQSLVSPMFNFLDWMNNEGEWTWRDMVTRRRKK